MVCKLVHASSLTGVLTAPASAGRPVFTTQTQIGHYVTLHVRRVMRKFVHASRFTSVLTGAASTDRPVFRF